MRRSPLFRLLSAVLALWFALGLVESAALHVCPMHDGGAARGGPAAAPGHEAAHAGEQEGMHGGAHAARAPSPGAPGHSEGHLCTCLGECGVAVAVAAPVVRISHVPTIVADRRPPVFRSRVTVRSASSYLFPPATAPPAVRVG